MFSPTPDTNAQREPVAGAVPAAQPLTGTPRVRPVLSLFTGRRGA